MIITASLTPLQRRGNITILGSYKDKETDKEMFLSQSGKRVMTTVSEGEKVFSYTFENGIPMEFKFDTEDFGHKSVIDFWKNHPLVFCDGHHNKNIISESFVFEIKEERIHVEYEYLLERLKATSIISGMTFEEQRSLSFALGGDPVGMTPEELYLDLIGNDLDGYGAQSYDEINVYTSIRESERNAQVYANKAISYGIINKEGSVFKVSGRNIGSDVDSVVALLMSDKDLFENYVKPEVDKHDKKELSSAPVEMEIPEELKHLIPASTASEKKKAGRPRKA
jgi:hypothetical protein